MITKILWVRLWVVLISLLLIGGYVYWRTESLLLLFSVIIVLVLIYVVLSYIAAKVFKNRQFKRFIMKYGMSISPKDNLDIIDGNILFDDDWFFAVISPIEQGLFIYKGFYCSSYIPWEIIKRITIFKENGKNYAKVVLCADGYRDVSFEIPWSQAFNEKVGSKVWLVTAS